MGRKRKGLAKFGLRFHNLVEYIRLMNASEILRRYFVMNSFDGVLTVLGLLLGAYLSGSLEANVVISITLATGFAMFVSGFFGTYMTEEAERNREMKEMERNLLHSLDKSVYKKATRAVALVSSLVDGGSPLLVSLVLISPFLFVGVFWDSVTAFYYSLGLSMLTLFVLGCYLGSISKESLIKSGIKMLSAGIFIIIVMGLLGISHA